MIAQTEPIADRKLLETDLPQEDGLSDQQRSFVVAYLRRGNATQAAIEAGYTWPRQAGYRLLHHQRIQTEIKYGLLSKQISPEQVFAELSEISFANLDYFLDEDGNVDIIKLKANGHLVKKYKCKRNHKQSTDEIHVTDVEIELHDRHAALVDVGKKYRMFGGETTVNVQVNVMSDILRELAPVLKECLDPGKREYFAQAMAEIAKRNGYQTSANPKVSATVEVKVNQASDSTEREIPVIHAGTGQT